MATDPTLPSLVGTMDGAPNRGARWGLIGRVIGFERTLARCFGNLTFYILSGWKTPHVDNVSIRQRRHLSELGLGGEFGHVITWREHLCIQHQVTQHSLHILLLLLRPIYDPIGDQSRDKNE